MMNQNEKISNQVDMSPEAIDRRLRELGQLYKLGMAIRQAKYLGKAKDFINNTSNPDIRKESRPLGILKGKASCEIKDDFEITDKELLSA